MTKARTAFRFTTLSALLIGLLFSPVHARAESATPAKLRFLFLDESPGTYALKLGNDFKQISSAPYAISPPYTPVDLRPLNIYKISATADPTTGEKVRVRVARITPPSATASALVILTPRAAEGDAPPAYGVEFIDSDESAYPLGTIRILNRGRAAMAAQFGKETVTVEPGGTKIVRPVTDTRFRLRTKVAALTPGGWSLLDSNVTILKADTRITGVLVFSPSGMRHLYDESTLYGRGPPPPGHVWLMYSDPL